MPQKFSPIDLSAVKTYNLSDRKSKVTAEDFAKTWQKGASYRTFLDNLPDILAGSQLKSVISAIVKAYRNNHTILFGMGAYDIKVGLNPIVIDLMQGRLINPIAIKVTDNDAAISRLKQEYLVGRVDSAIIVGIHDNLISANDCDFILLI